MRGPIRWWVGAVAAVVLLGLAIRLVPDTPPESDHAVTEILVLNVLHGHQAVGAYSRFGWNHPGPLYLQLLAPLFWLSGYRHLSVVITVAILNAACLIALMAIVRHFSAGHGVLVAGVAVFGLYLARMDGLLASSWNPHVGILPMALLIACAAASASGAPALLAGVIAIASFVIQAHLGSTSATLAITAAAVAMVAIDGARAPQGDRRRAPLVRTLGIAGVVGAALWALPLADAVRPGGQHNLQQIHTFFQSRAQAAPRAADRAFERFFVAPFTPHLKLWGDTPQEAREPLAQRLAPVEGILLVIAALVWALRRRRFESRLALLTIVGALAALAGVRRLPEYPKDYTILWVSALGVMSWTTILALPADAITSWIARKLPRARRALDLRLPAGAVAVILVATLWQVAARYADEARTASPVRDLTGIVRARLDEAATGSPLVHMPDAGWGTVAGVLLQLYRAGGTPHVDADWVSMFGTPFAPTGHESLAIRFADRAEHDTEFRFRSDNRALGSVGQMYVYSEEPRPPVAPVLPLSVAGSADVVGDPERLVDGRAAAGDAATVTFLSGRSFVALALPRGTIVAIRLDGEGATTWQISCSQDNEHFADAGRVVIPAGTGVERGEAFLSSLRFCPFARISPTSDTRTHWLSGIQPLAATGVPR